MVILSENIIMFRVLISVLKARICRTLIRKLYMYIRLQSFNYENTYVDKIMSMFLIVRCLVGGTSLQGNKSSLLLAIQICIPISMNCLHLKLLHRMTPGFLLCLQTRQADIWASFQPQSIVKQLYLALGKTF